MSFRRSSRRRGGGWAALVLLALGALLAAAEIQIPRSPSDWATDKAGFLSAGAVQSLNAGLRRYQDETRHQILVYIDKTTGGYPIEEYAVKAFEAWKPGRKGLDDGLILFIMVEDRAARIEVGYGLEDKVTDAQASRIINAILIPKIEAGDPDGAVREAVSRIQAVISGTAPPPEVSSPAGKKGGTAQTVLVIIGIIIFLIILITNPSLALWLLINILSGGRGGGGGGGGGGFSGGGGRSGGGGASGRW